MGDDQFDPTQAFNGLAEVYAHGRPSYPAGAIECIVQGLPASPLLVDVGCGTGISTRLLANTGRRTIGIEPNPQMAHVAREEGRREPTFEVHEARAEALGLQRRSVDLVSCFQSFHWFDQPATLAEFSRVLKPGGRIALVWNQRDLDDAFTSEYDRIIKSVAMFADPMQPAVRSRLDQSIATSSDWRALGHEAIPMRQSMDKELIVARASSASYFPTSGPERDRATRELRELAASTPEPALVYRTLVMRYELIRS